MVRTPTFLLAVVVAPVAAGLWDEVARNTDISALASARSGWLEEGRALDVGAVATAFADARLSIPGSGLNFSTQLEAVRSLEGRPRLDRRTAAFFLERWDELSLLSLGVGWRDYLSDPLNATGRDFSETTFRLSAARFTGPDELGLWNLAAEVAAIPRREEVRGELRAWRNLYTAGAFMGDLALTVGTLRATDADRNGLGRVEGWSYAQASLIVGWTPSPGNRLGLDFSAQAATEAPGRSDGVVTLSWSQSF